LSGAGIEDPPRQRVAVQLFRLAGVSQGTTVWHRPRPIGALVDEPSLVSGRRRTARPAGVFPATVEGDTPAQKAPRSAPTHPARGNRKDGDVGGGRSGWVSLWGRQCPASRAELRVRSPPVSRAVGPGGAVRPMSLLPPPFVSVIVPVRDASEHL